MISLKPTTDATLLHALHKKTFPGDKPPAFNVGAWWVLSNQGEAIGFCGLHPSSQWSDAAYMIRAGVVASHRGNGLQKRLIRVREQFAKRSGLAWLITDTYRNPASSNSLIATGFKIYRPASPWGAKETIYWRKSLKGLA